MTMLFRQFFDSESSTYTYLIASGVGREALIIDPVKAQVPQLPAGRRRAGPEARARH